MSAIHPTAVVEPGAEIGEGTRVGAFALIESGAVLGRENEVGSGVRIHGSVRMGHRNCLQHGAAIGGEPQSKDYKGDPTLCEIGDDNWFGEYVTVHRGSAATGRTVIGDRLFMMAAAHIAHDCRIGNDVTMTNAALAGGHVTLEDRVNMGAGAGCHQFVRVGRNAMVAGMARVVQDVVPFAIVANDNTLYGLNRIGIRRAGLPGSQMGPLKEAYRRFCVHRTPREDLLTWLRAQPENPYLAAWTAFLDVKSRRGYARAEGRGSVGDTGAAAEDSA